MPAKLSEKEKSAKGTAQRCRARKARPLKVIRRDIRELRKVISDVTFNVRLARKCIRAEGTFIETLVTNSSGRFENVRRINPAFKIHLQSLNALKSYNRQLEFLFEEREAAEAKQRKAEEFKDEFTI